MGRSKAWLPVGPEFLLQRVARVMSTVVEPLVVVAAADQELPPLPANVIRVDDVVEGQGPLGGLATGLELIQDNTKSVFVAACDMPFLTADLIQRLGSLLDDKYDIVAPKVQGKLHPLAAVYRPKAQLVASGLLDQGRRRMTDLLTTMRTREVDEADLGYSLDELLKALANLNTPQDYEEAIQTLE